MNADFVSEVPSLKLVAWKALISAGRRNDNIYDLLSKTAKQAEAEGHLGSYEMVDVNDMNISDTFWHGRTIFHLSRTPGAAFLGLQISDIVTPIFFEEDVRRSQADTNSLCSQANTKSPRPTSYKHRPALTQQQHCDGSLEQAVITAHHPRNNFGSPGLQQTLIYSSSASHAANVTAKTSTTNNTIITTQQQHFDFDGSGSGSGRIEIEIESGGVGEWL